MLIIYFSGIWSRKGAPAELLSAWRGRRFLFFYLCMEPRLTPEQIERFAKVDRGEEFGPAVSPQL